MKNHEVNITNKISISNTKPLILIAGPCVIENEDLTIRIADSLKDISLKLGISLIFKASYDKANRTSIKSYRGPGLKKGLKILKRIKTSLHLPILTDIHSPYEAKPVSEIVDVIQIPAFLCRQTDIIVEAAKTMLPINIKKGQFLAPEDIRFVIDKVLSTGNNKIILTERGTTFGYHNLVVDMRSLVIMKDTGYPVIFDATHSVQQPGQKGFCSGGRKEFIFPLARAATAIGIAGIFIETHPNPQRSLSDGANSIPLNEVKNFLEKIKSIDDIVKNMSFKT